MTALAAWLARTTANAPAALGARVREQALAEAVRHTPDAPPAVVLAAAARRALETVTSHEGDRAIALDLLAADALVTLALLDRAESAPATLGAFASALLDGYWEEA